MNGKECRKTRRRLILTNERKVPRNEKPETTKASLNLRNRKKKLNVCALGRMNGSEKRNNASNRSSTVQTISTIDERKIVLKKSSSEENEGTVLVNESTCCQKAKSASNDDLKRVVKMSETLHDNRVRSCSREGIG